MFADIIDESLAQALTHRSRGTGGLFGRLSGCYRAEVVETNDPLNMRRVRFRCPDLHDSDMKVEDCPWAVPAQGFGGQRSGQWFSLSIGDRIWIMFEKGHPYGPVYFGAADATRRKNYPFAAVSCKTPLPVDKDGKPAKQPTDYVEKYLPLDGRPETQGLVDRIGNMDLMSAIGFFPITQKEKAPPPPDWDAVAKTQFKAATQAPKQDTPDWKMMLRMTRYGNMHFMCDRGYDWREEQLGDPEVDEKINFERWKYLLDVLDEAHVEDNRGIYSITGFGHRIEQRDLGYDKRRGGEYGGGGKQVTRQPGLSDQRWIKLRSKGGMLVQLSDMGFDRLNDKFVKRLIKDEVGAKSEKEDQYWNRDARWIRLLTRYGIKIVLDDRDSHKTEADTEENPRPYGLLIKTRRTPSGGGAKCEGNPRGFCLELAEKDSTNMATLLTPSGIGLQLNDKLQYAMLATRRSDYPTKWKGLEDNEFLSSDLNSGGLVSKSAHVMLNLKAGWTSFKTRGGSGDPPLANCGPGPYVTKCSAQQGLECHDFEGWVDLNDAFERGLFFNSTGFVVCRAKQLCGLKNLYWWFNENANTIVVYNGHPGKIQLYCVKDIEIIADNNIVLKAGNTINLKAASAILMEGGGSSMRIGGGITCDPPIQVAVDWDKGPHRILDSLGGLCSVTPNHDVVPPIPCVPLNATVEGIPQVKPSSRY